MNVLEIIEFRTITGKRNKLELQLKEIIFEFNQKSPQIKIELYKHAIIDTDFSIHIHHYSKDIIRDKDSIGIYMIALLKEMGLVNHSVWVEKYSTNC